MQNILGGPAPLQQAACISGQHYHHSLSYDKYQPVWLLDAAV